MLRRASIVRSQLGRFGTSKKLAPQSNPFAQSSSPRAPKRVGALRALGQVLRVRPVQNILRRFGAWERLGPTRTMRLRNVVGACRMNTSEAPSRQNGHGGLGNASSPSPGNRGTGSAGHGASGGQSGSRSRTPAHSVPRCGSLEESIGIGLTVVRKPEENAGRLIQRDRPSLKGRGVKGGVKPFVGAVEAVHGVAPPTVDRPSSNRENGRPTQDSWSSSLLLFCPLYPR